MNKNIINDNELRALLKKINSIVMIGVSASPLRASFFVARYFDNCEKDISLYSISCIFHT